MIYSPSSSTWDQKLTGCLPKAGSLYSIMSHSYVNLIQNSQNVTVQVNNVTKVELKSKSTWLAGTIHVEFFNLALFQCLRHLPVVQLRLRANLRTRLWTWRIAHSVGTRQRVADFGIILPTYSLKLH